MGDAGAVPGYKLAQLESDAHHLTDDVRELRVSTAKRLAEERQFREQMIVANAQTAAQVARIGDSLSRLEVTQHSHAESLADLLTKQAEQRGSWKIVALIAGGVPFLIEVARHIWR